MKKVIYFILLLLVMALCNVCRTKGVNTCVKENNYEVVRIDSLNNWYIIYASKKDSIFKIVSQKNHSNDCKKISVGGKYDFVLYSRKTNVPKIGDIEIQPMNLLDIKCYGFDYQTDICIEPENHIYDLYFCENLQGLCGNW